VRHETPALATRAARVRLDYGVQDGTDDRVVAYGRSTGDDAVVVVLNFAEDAATVSVSASAGETDLVSGDTVASDTGAGETVVDVDTVAVLPADGF
jgi:hypothetical protein